jgi:CHASE3 domain sensor protein
MDDINIFAIGVFVTLLFVIGVFYTIKEFKQMNKKQFETRQNKINIDDSNKN